MSDIGASNAQSSDAVAAQNSAREAFRDSTDTAPPNWSGPQFKLSYDYPKTQPSCDAPWLKRQVSFNDPKAQWSPEWQAYVQDIVNYVKEGQDPNLTNNPGWTLAVKGETRWFHVPWMAYDGERGREYVHGLTNE